MLSELEKLSKQELIALIQQRHQQARKLESQAHKLEKQSHKLEKQAEYLQQENRYLKDQIEKLNRMKFGQQRERFIDPNQASLPFELPVEEQRQIEEQATEKITYERKKASGTNHPGRQPLPDHLPVEEIEIYPEEDTTDMVCIGKEVTEELEYKPASYFIRRYIRYKYAPKNKEGVFIGSLPCRVIDKGIAGPGLLASILVDKYTDHLPLYRQLQRFKRENIPLQPPHWKDGPDRG